MRNLGDRTAGLQENILQTVASPRAKRSATRSGRPPARLTLASLAAFPQYPAFWGDSETTMQIGLIGYGRMGQAVERVATAREHTITGVVRRDTPL
jgi:phosphoglycerate dehydrogenase-like enzyme